MALKKFKELQTGETGEYWRIVELTPIKQKEKLVFTLRLFKNKSYSDEGKPPLGISYSFECQLPDNYKMMTISELTAIAYAAIKGQVGTSPKPFKQMMFNDLFGAEDI